MPRRKARPPGESQPEGGGEKSVTRGDLIKSGGTLAAGIAVGALTSSEAAGAAAQQSPFLETPLPVKPFAIKIDGTHKDLQAAIIKSAKSANIVQSQILETAFANLVLANPAAFARTKFGLHFSLHFSLSF